MLGDIKNKNIRIFISMKYPKDKLIFLEQIFILFFFWKIIIIAIKKEPVINILAEVKIIFIQLLQ